jgi:hypothetical protein
MNRLMLGSGVFKREGWKTLDCNPAYNPDFLAEIPPFPAGVWSACWDEIEWIHGVTSLFPWQADEALTHLHEFLAPGGKLVLEQPNFRMAKERVEWLFGDASLKQPMIMNRWAYTPESLTAALRKSGFQRVDILPAQHHLPERDFRVEAYR